MAGDAVGHACYGLDFEDCLRLGGEGDCCFKGVVDAMITQELEEVCWVLIDYDFCSGDVDSEAVWEKFFFILRRELELGVIKEVVGAYSGHKGVQ